MSAFSTALSCGGANGFPIIPRLMDRGRELAASLGGEWMVLQPFGILLSLFVDCFVHFHLVGVNVLPAAMRMALGD